jgi:uncharacterized membrane protein YqgA involved in biofilm formation
MPGTGTFINVITILIGSSLGILLRNRLGEAYKTIILQGIGILTLVIGIQMALRTDNILLVLASVIVGALTGQYFNLDKKLDIFADYFKSKFARKDDAYFSEGFITASIIFCVGPMTILGAINDGLRGDIDLLAIKSVLDGFTSMALATTLGIGVLFSIITVIIIQGSITVFAVFLDQLLSELMINEMTAVGGVLIIAIGILLLDLKKIKVANFLPALIYAPLFAALYQFF